MKSLHPSFGLRSSRAIGALLVFGSMSQSYGRNYVDHCELKANPVQVKWDANEKTFQITDGARSRSRFLENKLDIQESTEIRTKNGNLRSHPYYDLSSESYHERRHESTESTVSFEAKQCPCAPKPDTFCLVNHGENVCRIGKVDDGGAFVDCFRNTPANIFTQNALPVAVLWLAAMLLYMVATEGGRSGLRYAISKSCGCFYENISQNRTYNNLLINDILRREAEARRRVQRMMSSSRAGANQSTPVTYILKTTEFKKEDSLTNDASLHTISDNVGSPGDRTLPLTPQSTRSSLSEEEQDATLTCTLNTDLACTSEGGTGHSDDDDEVTCTICIMEIEDGDRIGVLPCEHKFHVECLKEWIKRKNVCPLCQVPDIAREKGREPGENRDANEPSSERIRGERQVMRRGIINAARDRGERVTRVSVRRDRRNISDVQRDLFYVNGGGRRIPGYVRRNISPMPNTSGQDRPILVGDPSSPSNRNRQIEAARSRVNALNRS